MSVQSIYHSDESREYFSPEGCHILEILNTEAFSSFSIARARVEPGRSTQLHAVDGVEEAYYILSGEGRMYIQDDEKGTVTAGDVVLIPSGHSQKIKNTGSEDLLFLCVCAPRFREEAYKNLEEN